MSLQEDGEDAEHVGVTLTFQLLIAFAFFHVKNMPIEKLRIPLRKLQISPELHSMMEKFPIPAVRNSRIVATGSY